MSNTLSIMYANTENDIGSADLMLYMGFIGPNYSSGGGIAYLATVCEGDSYRKYKQSINNYGTSHSSMGELLAHEVGHNLGKLSLTNGIISNSFNSGSAPSGL